MPARKYWRIATFVALGVLLFSLVSVCLGLSAFGTLYLYYSQDLPPSARLDVQQLSQSVKIFDRTGTLLYEVTDPEGGHRTLVQPTQIPRVMKQAVIATEDPPFIRTGA